jgi:hypothetical protein
MSNSYSSMAPNPPPGPAASPAALFAACDLVPMGDGSYKAIPRKPKQKVTVKEAARIANYPLASIYRLFDAGFIEGERQSPRKIMIHVESLNAHLEAVRDPEFWTHARRVRYWGKPKRRSSKK